jgi:hypothetical protein
MLTVSTTSLFMIQNYADGPSVITFQIQNAYLRHEQGTQRPLWTAAFLSLVEVTDKIT